MQVADAASQAQELGKAKKTVEDLRASLAIAQEEKQKLGRAP